MTDRTSIAGPVTIKSDSIERVALDLAEKIDYHSGNTGAVKDEKYWLTLYWKCLNVAKGYDLDKVLAKK